MSLPHFEEFGWRPLVLTVEPDYVEGVRDSLLDQTIPPSVRVVGTKALPYGRTRQIGLGNLGLRALPYLRAAGNRILRQDKIDLIYFSTTVFPSMSLGPVWRRKFGVPYVLDFQDPWLSDYYDSSNIQAPPGGNLKYSVSQGLARFMEPRALRGASHVISVSPAYPSTLRSRYPWLKEGQFTVLPFGAAGKDFEMVDALGVRQSIFDPKDGKRHWVYVGRGGGDMRKSLRILFGAMSRLRRRDGDSFRSTQLHFIGTDYAPDSRATKTVEPIARECGVADLIEEQTARVPYFEALKIMLDSDAILLFGSDDPGYTASKLYPCILAQKPILAVFHEQSSVVEILRRCNAGRAFTFTSNGVSEDVYDSLTPHLRWLSSLPKDYKPETSWVEFEPFTAREMTRRQCEIFDRCLDSLGKGF